MKIIVKLQMEPDIKEIFDGNDLTVYRDADGLTVKSGTTILAQFKHWMYWVSEGFKDQVKEALINRETLLKDIEMLASTEPKDIATALLRIEKIKSLLSDRPHFPNEPDKAALSLNLDYVEGFVKKLEPGYPAETLMGAIYAVRQFVEHTTLPHWPIDPAGEEWSWEKFENSFEKLSPIDDMKIPR